MIQVGIITLFPELVMLLSKWGVTRRAFTQRQVQMTVIDLRHFAPNGRVDDVPFGGGGGMLLAYAPLASAIEHLKTLLPDPWIIYMSPAGNTLKQSMFTRLSKRNLIIVCGRYEGIDERIIEKYIDEEISDRKSVV